MRHVQEAIEDCYIEPLVNEYTNLLTHDIPAVLEYLTYNFGKVRSEEVTEKETEVMAMSWQPQDSLVLLIKPIENLQSLSKEACSIFGHAIIPKRINYCTQHKRL